MAEEIPSLLEPEDWTRDDALLIRAGKRLKGPPISAAPGVLMNATTPAIEADEEARRARYQDELDSAERLRRAQEQDRYFSAGIRPPVYLSEFAPPTAAQIQSTRPRFMNVRGDLYDVTTGVPRLAVDTPEPPVTRRPIWSEAETRSVPLGEGMQWIYGPSGWVQQPIPRKSDAEIYMGAGVGRGTNSVPSMEPNAGFTPPAAAPQSQIRSFNSEAEARRAGVKPGERIRIVGQGIGVLE